MEQINSSPEEIRSFISSRMWQDMCSDMNAWRDDIREQLEVQEDINVIRRLQGNIEAVHRFLDLPRVLLEHAEVELGNRSRR